MAVPSLMLVALIVAFVIALRLHSRAQEWSLHTREVLDHSQRLLTQLTDAQNGVRGYLLVRDPSLVAPYEGVRRDLVRTLDRLHVLTRDNPPQHARAVELRNRIAVVLNFYDDIVPGSRGGGLPIDDERAFVQRGQEVMDGIRGVARAFVLEERRLDDLRRADLRAAEQRLFTVAVTGAGASLFAVLALGLWFHRSIGDRVGRLTTTARTLAEGRTAVDPISRDELAAVDLALHEMADAIAGRQRAAVSALADAVRLFSAAGSRGAVLDVAAERALVLAGAGVAVCTLQGESADLQRVVAVATAPAHPTAGPAVGSTLPWAASHAVLRTGRVMHLSAGDRGAHPASPEVERAFGSGEWIGVPLHDDRRTPIGVLQVASLPGQTFRPDDAETLAMLAQAASVALALERSRQQLEATNADLAHTNRENELFVYSVSHDLRSPLVNLEGFSRELGLAADQLRQLLDSPEVPDDLRQRARLVLDGDVAESTHYIGVAVSRLAAIIDGLLRLSRAGRVEYRPQPLDLSVIVERVIDAMRATLTAAGGEIRHATLPVVTGDALAVEQLFANLIGNALAYARPGVPPRVEIAAADDLARSPRFTVVRISDNGLGIPAPHLDQVFQPLQRLHPGVGRGEGMGLAIVKRIVERHDGRVWVRSEVGVGTTFHVELPRESPEASSHAA
ncbi:CHASE3 domain-containing protein [Luteitalea sp.]